MNGLNVVKDKKVIFQFKKELLSSSVSANEISSCQLTERLQFVCG